jgi:hypothetical protein
MDAPTTPPRVPVLRLHELPSGVYDLHELTPGRDARNGDLTPHSVAPSPRPSTARKPPHILQQALSQGGYSPMKTLTPPPNLHSPSTELESQK